MNAFASELEAARRRQMEHQYRRETPGYEAYAHEARKGLFPTPLDALAAMQLPIVSDAAGFTSDVRRMRDDPAERTWFNAAMTGLGALPFVPSGLGIIKRAPARGAYPQQLAPEPGRQIEGFRAHRIFEKGPRAGSIYPVMIGKENAETALSQRIPQGEWLKSQLIPFVMAPRKGWHAGELPYGPQFNVGGKEAGSRFGRYQPDDVVYSRVLLGADKDFSGYRDPTSRGTVFDERNRLPFDQTELPEGGFYTYRPSGYELPWLVSDSVKHERLITDEEIADLFRSRGLEPPPRRATKPVTERRLRELGLDEWLTPR